MLGIPFWKTKKLYKYNHVLFVCFRTKTNIQIHHMIQPFRSGSDRTVHRWIDPTGPPSTGSHFQIQCLHINNFVRESTSKLQFVYVHTCKIHTNPGEMSADNVAVSKYENTLCNQKHKYVVLFFCWWVTEQKAPSEKWGRRSLFTLLSLWMLVLCNRQILT